MLSQRGLRPAFEKKHVQFKAVLFDLDGTLLDTLGDIALTMNKVLEENGLPLPPPKEYRYFVGDGARTLVYRTLPLHLRDKEEVIEDLLGQFLEAYRAGWDKNTKLYNGIPEMLDTVCDRGIEMAVLSNKPHEFTCLCVERYLGPWSFGNVLGEKPGIARKPDPAGALTVARQLGIKPEEFLYVGDTSIDIKTATSAGMYPVGVLWGFRDRQELQEAGAKALLERPEEIAALF